jgi:signal transduction histidine kinase
VAAPGQSAFPDRDPGGAVPGEHNCIFLKSLIPFVEQEAGPAGVEVMVRAAGKPREWLIADHNWVSHALADRLVRLAMELMGATDVETWARRWGDFHMDWKPSHEERSYMGAYTMGLGSPRAVYERAQAIDQAIYRCSRTDLVELRRNRAVLRVTPAPGFDMPRWFCIQRHVGLERYPTNWGLPRARIIERACAAKGDPACVWDVRWRNPPRGRRFWAPAIAGSMISAFVWLALGLEQHLGWTEATALAALPALAGVAAGAALLERRRRLETRRLLDIQAEEILHANQQLERKFRDLETKIEQLSLLSDLAAAVNATLDPEKIYEQALQRLVHGMGYQGAYLFLVDPARRRVRGHRRAGGGRGDIPFDTLEFRLDDPHCGASRVASTGLPIVVDDVETTPEAIDLPTAHALGVRSAVMIPLRVKARVFGVLNVTSSEPGRVGGADLELLSAVANHVALAVERAESFQTIEDLSRGLEDKVRVRTEQLRTAHEDLQGAYRELQATQMQLIQREKMASVGQLVAGVAHELNNPIGFVYSNVSTLEDFVRRLRGMLEVYRGVALADAEQARVQAEWDGRKIDYALRYLDSMILGIKEGAERARKIVRDLRVFARSQDDVWQSVDLHEELESSLTLINHLLKDRVTVERKLGELPPVECIRSQIDQVFLNLLANAAQAIPGSGSITLETRREDGMAVVSIADSGPGIPPEVSGRIFDPFFTTKPVGEGTGLGLSISYEIVKKHGGDIRAQSPAAGGAVFTVRIPVARAAAP